MSAFDETNILFYMLRRNEKALPKTVNTARLQLQRKMMTKKYLEKRSGQ